MADTTIFLNSIGMIFELFIIIISGVLLILIFRKYLLKRHHLTLLLFIIFLLYFLSIVFSWLSKVIVVTQFTVVQDGSIFPWIINRLRDFRLSEFFVSIAIFMSYILKVRVFEKGFHPIFKYIVIAYGIFTGFYVLVIYEIGNTLLDIFAFLFVFIYMCMIYFPFMIRSFQSYKSIEESVFKKAFLSLAIMSISFTLIFLNFAIDRVLIFLGSPGFTTFYFLAWIFAIIGILGAYFGYIRPKSKA